jgi:hypothetical protein
MDGQIPFFVSFNHDSPKWHISKDRDTARILIIPYYPCSSPGTTTVQQKKVSLLVSSSGILHYSVTTVPCWRLRGVSGERLKHAQVQAICQLPDRTDGLDCTELSVLSAIWCYLWFSEADTFRYMAFPVAGQSQHSGSQPAATLAEDAPWKPGAVHAQCTAVAQQGLILFFLSRSLDVVVPQDFPAVVLANHSAGVHGCGSTKHGDTG